MVELTDFVKDNDGIEKVRKIHHTMMLYTLPEDRMQLITHVACKVEENFIDCDERSSWYTNLTLILQQLL